MDLIDLYHRRGIALVRSKLRATPAARKGYARLARHYADQIEERREDRAITAIGFEPAL